MKQNDLDYLLDWYFSTFNRCLRYIPYRCIGRAEIDSDPSPLTASIVHFRTYDNAVDIEYELFTWQQNLEHVIDTKRSC